MPEETLCPEWPLIRGLTRGAWTDSEVEFFGRDNQYEHVHFYWSKTLAMTLLQGLPQEYQGLVSNCSTWSFKDSLSRVGAVCTKCQCRYEPVDKELLAVNPNSMELRMQLAEHVCWDCAYKTLGGDPHRQWLYELPYEPVGEQLQLF